MKQSLLYMLLCLLLSNGLVAQHKFYGKKKHHKMVYDFVSDVMKEVGTHGGTKVYLEEEVRGNKCYESKPDLIFLDRIKLMDIKILDAYLTQKDINFMRKQAKDLLFKKWNSKLLDMPQLEILPSSSARKEAKHKQQGIIMGISLPFFSEDGQKAIFFMCRQDIEDGWDAIALYKKTTDGWKLVTTKLSMWHNN